MITPAFLHRWKWSPSIPQAGRQCSPSKQSCLQDIPCSRPSIVWNKDGNPFLPGAARSQHLLGSQTAMSEAFLSSTPNMKWVHPYLPQVRHLRLREITGVHPGKSRTTARILTRQTATSMQTAPIWTWNVPTQTVETHAPTTMHLVGEGSWIWANKLEMSLPSPSTRDSSISAVIHGVASFQWPHHGNTPLLYTIRSRLILSTSFHCPLDCALKQARCSS